MLSVFGSVLLLIPLLVISYLILLPFGTLIPVNRKFQHAARGVDIFLSTNGMHVDFIIPTQHPLFDWTKIIDGTPFDKPLDQYPYLGIGWGDPGFYLELEAWDKLSVKIAARAMLIPTPTIMHVTGYDALPTDKLRVEKVTIPRSRFVQLSSFIYNSFALTADQEIDLIPGAGYTENDNFYHANGVYHAFHTCNYWVNKGLKRIGVRTALWAPFERGIFYQLNKIEPPMVPREVPVLVPVESNLV